MISSPGSAAQTGQACRHDRRAAAELLAQFHDEQPRMGDESPRTTHELSLLSFVLRPRLSTQLRKCPDALALDDAV
jgi:hypothetical protein